MNIVKELLKEREIRESYFKNYLEYAFGSVVNGNYHIMLSDIDIAIILKEEVLNKEK